MNSFYLYDHDYRTLLSKAVMPNLVKIGTWTFDRSSQLAHSELKYIFNPQHWFRGFVNIKCGVCRGADFAMGTGF